MLIIKEDDMIFFDCERLKHPNTGLFSFCDQLSNALYRQASLHPEHKLGFYVPKNYIGRFGKECCYIKNHSFQECFFWNPRIKLWHSAYQLTRCIPYNTRIIQTIHDLNYLYEALPKERKKYLEKRISNNVKKVSRLIAISEFVKKDVLNHFDLKDIPIDVIYNGCNIYSGPINAPVQQPVRPFLFAIGTMFPKKNFHALPCLLAHNDYDLIIAGTHNDMDYLQQVYDEVRKWNVSGRVHLIGPVSEAEKHWYLKHCIAFLLPSIAEGFGLPAIEAMQYGKPVFLSSHTCLPEIGGSWAYYFNYDFDRRAMQDEFQMGMDDFYNGYKNPDDIKAHALRFSWDNSANQYWSIYKEELGQ